MSAFMTHYLIRLKASVTSPYALGVMLFTGFMSLMYWPGLIDPAAVGLDLVSEETGIDESFLLLLWIYVWPMLAGSTAGGSVDTGGRDSLAMRPMPGLPVGTKTRVFAEALVILTFVFVIRIPSFICGEAVHGFFYLPKYLEAGAAARAPFLQRTFLGAAIMLPSILIWTAPARSVQLYFLGRPMALIVLYFAAMKAGLLATPWGCALASAVFSMLVVWSMDLEFNLPDMGRRSKDPNARWRRGRDPEKQLRRDLWLKPLPLTLFFLVLQAGVFGLDQLVVLPKYGFYFLSVLVISFLGSFVAMRPMGNQIIAAGGKVPSSGGSRASDFYQAWCVLPVRREAVLRGVYLHGLLTGAGVWVLAVLVALLRGWATTGEMRLAVFDGESSGRYMLPFILLVPCLAGGLTNAAVGDRLWGYVSLGAGFMILLGHHLLLILKLAPSAHYGILILLALLGGVPALSHLRAPLAVDKKG